MFWSICMPVNYCVGCAWPTSGLSRAPFIGQGMPRRWWEWGRCPGVNDGPGSGCKNVGYHEHLWKLRETWISVDNARELKIRYVLLYVSAGKLQGCILSRNFDKPLRCFVWWVSWGWTIRSEAESTFCFPNSLITRKEDYNLWRPISRLAHATLWNAYCASSWATSFYSLFTVWNELFIHHHIITPSFTSNN